MYQFLLFQLVMSSSLQVVIRLIEILLFDFDLRNLIQSTALQKLIIAHAYDLLKVQDRIVAIIQLFQRLSLIKVALTHRDGPPVADG